MTWFNWTGVNQSLYYVGQASINGSILNMSYEQFILTFGWWLLVIVGVGLAVFFYIKSLVLALFVIGGLAVCMYWVGVAGMDEVTVLALRATFGLLIGAVLLYLIQEGRQKHVSF